MSDVAETERGRRDRSPSFPFIPLATAIERLTDFEGHHKRGPVPPDRVGPAWGLKANSSQAQQTLAALKAFGLLETRRGDSGRSVVVSEQGRKYLLARQDSTKQEVLRQAALQPKQIGTYWADWKHGRPKDAACLDTLTFSGGFSRDGAEKFLYVYDETIAYAGLTESDKMEPDEKGESPERDEDEDENNDPITAAATRSATSPAQTKVRLMEGERELTTGLLSKDTNFRLIVSGRIGVKEIERLIKKLELDKEILADQDEEGNLKEGSRVRVRENLAFSLNRVGQIGSVIQLYVLPGDGGTRANVSFEDNVVERGIRVEELEVVLSPD